MYDPKFDISPVDQIGYLDLRQVFDTGVVSGDFDISDEHYNRASPDDLMHRPDDVFASMRQRDYVKSSLSVQAQPEQVTE